MGEKENAPSNSQQSPGRRLVSRLPRLGQAMRRQDPNLPTQQKNQSTDSDSPKVDSTPGRKKAGQSEASSHQEFFSHPNRTNYNPSPRRLTSPLPHQPVVAHNTTPSPSGRSRVEFSEESLSLLRTPTPIRSPGVVSVSKNTATAGLVIPSPDHRFRGLRDNTPRRFFLQERPGTNQPAEMGNLAEVAAAPPTRELSPPLTEKAESTLGQNDGQNEAKELANSSADGIGKDANGSKPEAKEAPDQSSANQDNGSYAEALKTGLTNGDTSNEDDFGTSEKRDRERSRHPQDDESDPDLDDMGLDEVYRVQKQRKKDGSIRWAPWNVPFRRRAQTFVVLMHCLSIVSTVSLFFALCANPFAWPLLLIYLLHLLTSKAATDGSLSYRWDWFRRNWIWHLFAEYFPAKLHKTCDLPPTRKYIFGYHPHGIISHGAWAAFATDALGFSEKFPGITNSLLTLDSNFRVPIYRDYILTMGVRSVSKESIINILTKGGDNGEGMGRGVTVVVGGARESLEAQPGNLRLILRERKGFIKIAVRTGADLVPVLCFGENELYDQLPPGEHPLVHRLQMFVLKVWKFTLPFMHGRGIFNYDVGLMPYRHPLNIVVGAPIKVEQQPISSSNSPIDQQEYIDRLHGLYVDELVQLWERYKDEFAPERKGNLEFLA